jgi:ubiquinone/menaquinone biosynthesis C-methylase UbiE
MDAKELAYLHDLYVAPDWGERFAELLDESIDLPEEGEVLYISAGTGGHALALLERASEDVQLVCTDEDAERLEIARAKADVMKLAERVKFRVAPMEKTGLDAGRFDLVIAEASLTTPARLPQIFAEAVRVATYDGLIALGTTTAASFGEFFSIYWEALDRAGLDQIATDVVSRFINEQPTISHLEEIAEQSGLKNIKTRTRIEEFRYDSGEDFLNSPFIAHFLLEKWLAPIPEIERRSAILREIAQLIDEERHHADFPLTYKATVITGHKR